MVTDGCKWTTQSGGEIVLYSIPQHCSQATRKSYSKDYKKCTLIFKSSGVTSLLNPLACFTWLSHLCLPLHLPTLPPAPPVTHTHLPHPGHKSRLSVPWIAKLLSLCLASLLFLSLINSCHPLSLSQLVTHCLKRVILRSPRIRKASLFICLNTTVPKYWLQNSFASLTPIRL